MKKFLYALTAVMISVCLSSCVVELYPYAYYPTHSYGYYAPRQYTYHTYHHFSPYYHCNQSKYRGMRCFGY
jgi:hypothetical protein